MNLLIEDEVNVSQLVYLISNLRELIVYSIAHSYLL